MTKKDLIMNTIEKMGYTPEIDEDGDICLHYQMKTFYVMTGNEEEPYACVMLPQFHEIEDDTEMLVLATCNKVTRDLKMAKVYIDQTFKYVTASCEFFYANEEALELSLSHSFRVLGIVRSVFRDDLEVLSEDEG